MSEPVAYVDGRVELSESERGFWLKSFGDARLLDLALIAAASDVMPNARGSSPYIARVRSFLARMAYSKIERDGRYKPEKAQLSRPTPGTKRLAAGTPAFDAVVARLERTDPIEARQARRRGFVWAIMPNGIGPRNSH